MKQKANEALTKWIEAVNAGDVDLIFPHHDNEIAQSEAATGKPCARHWFHIAHLRVNGEKMSKSLGNLFVLDEVIERGHSPEALRHLLFSGHYRQPLNFTWESLAAAESSLKRIYGYTEGLAVDIPSEVRALAGRREAARAARNWEEADALRDALLQAGWEVRDSVEGFELSQVALTSH